VGVLMNIQRARLLRANQTELERNLWFALRQLKRLGFHFRRQAPIGKYIADFACHGAKLIVELDGSQHAEPKQAAHDAERTAFLESRGYRVIRIWNGELIESFDGVVDFIYAAAKERKELLSRPPPDTPRPAGVARDSIGAQGAPGARSVDLPARGR
jgi:very-short-patch-repair endonuclease